MRVGVYEHLCAQPPPDGAAAGLLAEGAAMLRTLLATLSRVEGVETAAVIHPHAGPLIRLAKSSPGDLRELARSCDRVVLVAPELDGALVAAAETVLAAGGRLFGPDLAAVRRCSDKRLTFADPRLAPWAVPNEMGDAARVVVKPADGAGAVGTFVAPAGRQAEAAALARAAGATGPLLVQPFWPGRPASVGVVRRHDGTAVVLPACSQRIIAEPVDPADPDGVQQLSFAGGAAPLPPPLQRRARALADRVLGVYASAGFFGVDLLLGADAGGDRLVEINPRPTTSVVAVDALLGGRLGHWLLGRETAADRDRLTDIVTTAVAGWAYAPDGTLTAVPVP